MSYKVMIVDDEPKVRRKLQESIDWEKYDMEISGEAEDGEMACALAQEIKPDIILLDINIPFMNGLAVAERVNGFLPNCVIILITGYDEFSFAQQAVKLNVFEYILKPVSQSDFESMIAKAKYMLDQRTQASKYLKWAQTYWDSNKTAIRERFLNDWVLGKLTEQEIEEQGRLFQIELPEETGILMVKVTDKARFNQKYQEWDRQLLLFAVQNIVEDVLGERGLKLLFRDDKDRLIVLAQKQGFPDWNELDREILAASEQYLKCMVHVLQSTTTKPQTDLPVLYNDMVKQLMNEQYWSPIVTLVKNYIDSHYYLEDLSLQSTADQFQISPAYLSRLMRQEIGGTFVDYLSSVRIRNAIRLLKDPSYKIYDIAVKVGYANQHYFSKAFKRVTGTAPTDYRKKAGEYR